MSKLTEQEIIELLDAIGEKLGYDRTSPPVFADGRDDVAVVRRTVEDGSSYGYDIVYAVWKDADGLVCYRECMDTKASKDYLLEGAPRVEGIWMIVTISSGGSF